MKHRNDHYITFNDLNCHHIHQIFVTIIPSVARGNPNRVQSFHKDLHMTIETFDYRYHLPKHNFTINHKYITF